MSPFLERFCPTLSVPGTWRKDIRYWLVSHGQEQNHHLFTWQVRQGLGRQQVCAKNKIRTCLNIQYVTPRLEGPWSPIWARCVEFTSTRWNCAGNVELWSSFCACGNVRGPYRCRKRVRMEESGWDEPGTWWVGSIGSNGSRPTFYFFHLDSDTFQLITWSKDKTLRFWRVNREMMAVSFV